MPITIKKTINIKIRNSFNNNRIGVKEKEAEKAKKEAEKVIVKTRTQTRRSTRM